MIERQAQILERVTEHERVHVPELAGMFDVSEVTIRKDLDSLERRGLIHREHGFAVVASPDDLRGRLAIDHELKTRIAAAAAGLVGDDETVMIESGSCCALLAADIAADRRGCTIVTNSAFIADYVRCEPGTGVVLLGGEYQPESQVTVGPLAEQNAAGFFVRRAFVGIDGYDHRAGFTARSQARAAVVRAMAKQADEVVVLTVSSKFSERGAVRLLPADAVSRVVTDSGLPDAVRTSLRAAGIAVTEVEGVPTPRSGRTVL